MSETGMPAEGQYTLCLDDGMVISTLVAPGASGYIIGRTDKNSRFIPDIDLAPYDGLNHGVSRRHIALVSYRGGIHIVDLASVNGTFINERRIYPETPSPLQPGDVIRLGTINLSLIKVE